IDTNHVLQLSLEGQLSLTEYQRLQRHLQPMQGRVRAMSLDLDALRIEPSDEDLRHLRAQGYLAHTLDELRTLQAQESSTLVRDALLILGGLLTEASCASSSKDAVE